MSCHPHDTSSGDGGVSNDAKLHNYLQLANDKGEKLLRNDENDNEDENTERASVNLQFSSFAPRQRLSKLTYALGLASVATVGG